MNIFIDPVHSYLPLLWFIYTPVPDLSGISITRTAHREQRVLIFAVTLLSVLLQDDRYVLRIDRCLHNLAFFAFGFMLASARRFQETICCMAHRGARGRRAPLAFILMNTAVVRFLPAFPGVVRGAHPRAVALARWDRYAYCAQCCSMRRASNRISTGLERLGYLFDEHISVSSRFSTGSVRVIVEQALPAGCFPFVLTTVLAIGAGLMGPLALEKYVFRKNVFARKFILGLS